MTRSISVPDSRTGQDRFPDERENRSPCSNEALHASTPLPGVSVVVPCRNEGDTIAGCLESIRAQEDLPDGAAWELLVVDGMSDDGTREAVARIATADPRVRLIDNPKRIVPAALNAGIAAARGEIIVRMDAHTEYAPDYLRQCVALLETTGAHNVGGPARTRARGRLQRAIAAAYHSPFSVGGARFHDPEFEGEVDTVVYGCWRKETLLRVGLFDEELVRNQDDELNFRLRLRGGRLWQSPRIRSWYRPRASLRSLFRQYCQYGYWKVRVIQKHGRPASARHLVPVCFTLGLALGWIAGVFWSPLGWAYGAAMALYAALSLGFSVAAARKAGWDLLPLLPVVLLVYHTSYGAGFARGLLDFVVLRRGASNGMTALTRPAAGVSDGTHPCLPAPGRTLRAKRAFDAVVAGLGLLALSPLLLLVALAVKLGSRGPVLFRQERIGRHFRPFFIYKFRSMVPEAPRSGAPITAGDDPRITAVGRILRKTKLDELPQLFNVLRGDMSLVGPRPEVPRYVELFRQDYEAILQLRPGITDLASISYHDEAELLGRAEDPEREYVERVLPDKIRLAREYVGRASLRFDLALIVKTLLVMATSRFRRNRFGAESPAVRRQPRAPAAEPLFAEQEAIERATEGLKE